MTQPSQHFIRQTAVVFRPGAILVIVAACVVAGPGAFYSSDWKTFGLGLLAAIGMISFVEVRWIDIPKPLHSPGHDPRGITPGASPPS